MIHIDEEVSSADLTMAVDLVGITFHTPSAFHAYDLAAQFRKRGIPVALGGPHVTLMPDEAQAHADVIFVGEAESYWPQFLKDFEIGRHTRRYCSTIPPALNTALIGAQGIIPPARSYRRPVIRNTWLPIWLRFLRRGGDVPAQSANAASGGSGLRICLVSGQSDHLLGR